MKMHTNAGQLSQHLKQLHTSQMLKHNGKTQCHEMKIGMYTNTNNVLLA